MGKERAVYSVTYVLFVVSICSFGRSPFRFQEGNFTCITENSKSVIDYFFVETSVFDDILNFEVGDRLKPIHMPLKLTLSFLLRRQRNADPVHKHLTNNIL